MSGLTNYGENLLTTWMFTTTAATRPTAWYVALHTADPTEVGNVGEVTVGTDANYARKAVTFANPSNGQSLSAAQVAWTVAAGSAGYTVTHASIWDALTGGNCLMKGQLPVQRVQAANDVLVFAIGEVIAAMD
jgi:hypothetical protein